MARSVALDAGGLLTAAAAALVDDGVEADDDRLADRALDAAAALFAERGIRRTTMDDIAERSGVGRTTLYRRFGGRDPVVAAVLGRECRRFVASVVARTAACERLEDAVVEGFVVGRSSPEMALLAELARREPDVLRLLTLDAGPLVDAAVAALGAAARTREPDLDPDAVAALAEVGVRVALSAVLSPSGTLAVDDPERVRRTLHALVDPALAQLRSA